MTAAALRRQATGEAALEDLKPRKFKPGTRAVMEIRKMQRTAGLLLRRAPFARLCKEASQLFAPDFRYVRTRAPAIMAQFSRIGAVFVLTPSPGYRRPPRHI